MFRCFATDGVIPVVEIYPGSCFPVVSLLSGPPCPQKEFMNAMKKIYACTTLSFPADNIYWQRDTGLICRSLRNAGIESKCIMPLPGYEEDLDKEYLIRAAQEELESADWWKSLHLDGLVLYSWGGPKYTPVIRAAHEAGIKIMAHLDRGICLLPSWDSPLGYITHAYTYLKAVLFNIFSSRHLLYADYVSASRPLIEQLKASWMFSDALNGRYREFACPVASHFVYDGTTKEERVICVGRWSDDAIDEVKRPSYLRAVAEHFTDLCEDVPFEIYGRYGETMRRWYENLPKAKQARIKLMGAVRNEQLVAAYKRSMISICPSRSEGTHIASAEALNCGASIVAGPQPRLKVMHWYISLGAGTIAKEDNPDAFARAIIEELQCWRRGERAPERIAQAFNESFHADKAVLNIFKELL